MISFFPILILISDNIKNVEEEKNQFFKTEIIIDVLEMLRKAESLNKTELIYAAHLNYAMLCYERASCIINWLMEHELVKWYQVNIL